MNSRDDRSVGHPCGCSGMHAQGCCNRVSTPDTMCAECNLDLNGCGCSCLTCDSDCEDSSAPLSAPTRGGIRKRMTGRPVWPCNTPHAAVVSPRPLASVRRFGPLSEWAICFCQCPHAPTGCKHEVARSDNTIYCDFCYFESDDPAERWCDCSCEGCDDAVHSMPADTDVVTHSARNRCAVCGTWMHSCACGATRICPHHPPASRSRLLMPSSRRGLPIPPARRRLPHQPAPRNGG